MSYIEEMQEMFYEARKGSVYGCFEVVDVEWDPVKKKQRWTMRCIHCGMEKKIYCGGQYVSGRIKGRCQCRFQKKQPVVKIEPKVKPKMSDHPLYKRWKTIKERCYRKSDKDYKNYGGRGIVMCDEWRDDFWSFAEWAESSGFSEELTIDRIDNDGIYCPENCRWITRAMQNKNKRNTPLYGGRTLPDICAEHDVGLGAVATYIKKGYDVDDAIGIVSSRRNRRRFTDWCRANNIEPTVMESRMKKGLTVEEAINYKGNLKGVYRVNGELRPLKEWCEIYGITEPAVEYRMKVKGMDLYTALTAKKAVRTGRPPKKRD